MLTKNQSYTALLTLAALVVGYFAYEHTVGQLTDFEQLPEELAGPMADDSAVEVDPQSIRESEVAAVRGFGPDCQERVAPLTLESRKPADMESVPGRGAGIFVYAQDYQRDAEDPKLMRLHPFSLVQVKPSASGNVEEDEIVTVRGDEAYLEFDQPVELTRPSGMKPVAGRVQGNVEVKSNGRTVDPADDIVVLTDMLHYRESKNLVWADGPLRVLAQDKGTVTGVGMELELYPEPPPGAPKRKDPARRIRIFKNVRFDLLVDEDENFLGAAMAPESTKAPASEGAAATTGTAGTDSEKRGGRKEPTPLTITSRGPFEYDLETRQAKFSRSVQVLRTSPAEREGASDAIDQLESDQLELVFREKTELERQAESSQQAAGAAAGAAASANGKSTDRGVTSLGAARGLKLQSVIATGKQVILISDSEHLQATGNFLLYNADTRRAELRSNDELVAIHDNAIIHARSLVIDQGAAKDIRNFIADGPRGWLEILEEQGTKDGTREGSKEGTKPEKKPELTIRWQGRLTMESKPGNETRMVTITDNVELEDDRGAIKSDLLKVWLVPTELPPTTESTASAAAAPTHRRKLEPVKMEATGRVSAHSPDLTVVTENLSVDIVKRKQPEAGTGRQGGGPEKLAVAPLAEPGRLAKPRASATPAKQKKGFDPKPGEPAAPVPPVANQDNKPGAKANEARAPASAPPAAVVTDRRIESTPGSSSSESGARDKPDEPLDVQARRVAVVVERVGKRSRPIRAWADGEVLVTQVPSKPDDEPIEVRGQTLHFERKDEGDLMKVDGSDRRLASVKSSDATICGRNQILFDEVNNRVTCSGPGYILRESATDLVGKAVETPQLLRIDWEKGMDFDGKLATFEGSVKAQQGSAEIHCQNMDVTFDEKIHFRQSREMKLKKAAVTKSKILTVDCDKDVIVYDAERREDGSERYSTLRAAVMHFDNQYRTMVASGPGVTQTIEKVVAKPDASGKVVAPRLPYQLTQVAFLREMRGDQTNQTGKFFESVHIVHTPVARVDQTVDEDQMDPDGVIIDAADMAAMAVRTGADGGKYRDFQAEGNVRVQAREFTGQCDRLTYDQEKDRLVLASQGGRMAQFYRQLRAGEKPQEYFARTITYVKRLNKISTDSSDGFHSFDVVPGAGAGNSLKPR